MGKYKGFSGAGMNTSKNVPNMLKQAQMMQEQMQQMQADVESKEIETVAGGGMVKVVANGKKEILSIKINPDIVDPDDVETLEDVVMVAVNDAMKKADDMMSEAMKSITGGLNIPGLF